MEAVEDVFVYEWRQNEVTGKYGVIIKSSFDGKKVKGNSRTQTGDREEEFVLEIGLSLML